MGPPRRAVWPRLMTFGAALMAVALVVGSVVSAQSRDVGLFFQYVSTLALLLVLVWVERRRHGSAASQER